MLILDDNPSKKAKLSVHERLGKQHSDDGKILTKSKKFDINDYDDPPSKKPRMDERQRIQSSIGSRVERRRSFDDNNGRMSKSGLLKHRVSMHVACVAVLSKI